MEPLLIHHQISGPDNNPDTDSKPTLVFVHGLTCAMDDWTLQTQALADSHRCICVDLRGHGQSAHLPPPYDMETLAGDLVALLYSLDVRRSILIGHSMGTRVITAAHLQAPERIHGLIYVDGSKQAAGDPQVAVETIRSKLQDDSTVSTFVRSMFGAMFIDRSDAVTRDVIIQRAVDMPAATLRTLLSNLLAWDAGRMVAAISQVHIPLTVLQSTNVDENRVRRCLEANESTPYLSLLKQHVQQCDIRVVPDSGHFTQLDAPESVNNAIREMSAEIGNG
jgi:pimeloyl-ACP methyl ester carboxylesterase